MGKVLNGFKTAKIVLLLHLRCTTKTRKVLFRCFTFDTKMYGVLHVSRTLTERKRVSFMYFENIVPPKQHKWGN